MYSTPRCPDALVEGVPFKRFIREEAAEALSCAASSSAG